jgi:hypothetical protein
MFHSAESFVLNEDDRVYLVDRHGERWDITQARSIGFDPDRFEFGIGRNAFRPLSDNDWSFGDRKKQSMNSRIIGVEKGQEAHAYSVSKLSHHETANTVIDSEPIVVGY